MAKRDFNPEHQKAKERFDFNPIDYLRRGENLHQKDSPVNDYSSNNARDYETDPTDYQSSQDDFTFNNQATQASGRSRVSFNFKNTLKKGGPVAFLSVTLLSGGVLMGIFLTPSLLINHTAELLKERFNTQAYSGLVRSNKLTYLKWRKGRGIDEVVEKRGGFIKKSERFTTVNQKQIDRYKKNGIEFETEDAMFGRKRIKQIKYTDPNTSKITIISDPTEYRKLVDLDPTFRSKVFTSTKGRFGHLHDAVVQRVKGYFGINFRPIRGSASDADNPDVDGKPRKNPLDNELDSKVKNSNTTGNSMRNVDEFFDDLDRNPRPDISPETSHNGRALKEMLEKADGIFKKSLRVISGIVNVFDKMADACHWYNTINHAIYIGKVIKAAQMARYGIAFLSMAESLKAGDATEEEMTYFANKLTATNPIHGNPSNPSEITGYEPTALDSYGMFYALTGKAGPLDESAREYQLGIPGGTMAETFVKIRNNLNNVYKVKVFGKEVSLRLNASQVCKVVDNNFAMVAQIVASVVLAVLSGGASFEISTAINAAGSLAVGVGMEFGSRWAAETVEKSVKGSFADHSTKGEDMGNALAAGSGAGMSKMAIAGGNMPLSKGLAMAYLEEYQNSIAQYGEEVRATHSPFDITTRHTMMGSIVSGTLPYMARMNSFVGRLGSIASYASRSFGKLLPTASAMENHGKLPLEAGALEICQDPEFIRLGAALDPFCNFIMGIPVHQLNHTSFSPNYVLDYFSPGTFEEEVGADGQTRILSSEAVDYSIPIGEDGQYTVDLDKAIELGHWISGYIVNTLNLNYLKPVKRSGEECHIEPIIDYEANELISPGAPNYPHSDEQMKRSCLDHTGKNYEYDWVLNDRESVCLTYVYAIKDKRGRWVVKHEKKCPKKGKLITDNKENPLAKFKTNCINRGSIPFGMQQLQEAATNEDAYLQSKGDPWESLAERLFGSEFADILDEGWNCVLTGDTQRTMFALYFMDERIQCMIDNHNGQAEDCDTSAMVGAMGGGSP